MDDSHMHGAYALMDGWMDGWMVMDGHAPLHDGLDFPLGPDPGVA